MPEPKPGESPIPLEERRAYTEGVFQAIASQPNHLTGEIPVGEHAQIDLSTTPLGYEDFGGKGVDQTLHAVIKSRYHIFGVVRLRSPDLDQDGFVVTRFSENPHWSRTEAAEPMDADTTIDVKGRPLFTLRQDGDKLSLTALASHGVEVTVAQPAEEAPAVEQKAETFGFKAAWKNLRRGKQQTSVPANPLTHDPNTWLASMDTYGTLLDLQEFRKEPPASELFLTLQAQNTSEARDAARADIQQQKLADPEVQAVLALQDEQEELYKKYEHADPAEKLALSFDIQRVQADIWENHREGAVRSQELAGRERMLDLDIMTLDRGDPRLAFLEEASPGTRPAPEVIVAKGQHIVPKHEAIEKLKTLPFMRVGEVDAWRLKFGQDGGIRAAASRQEPFMIPLDQVVSAEGLDSWAGRGRDGGAAKDTHTTSIDAIIDYASRETDIPAVDDLVCFVQPDGQRYFVSENAHRTAAFKARGATHLPVSSVKITLLSHNVLGRRQEGEV